MDEKFCVSFWPQINLRKEIKIHLWALVCLADRKSQASSTVFWILKLNYKHTSTTYACASSMLAATHMSTFGQRECLSATFVCLFTERVGPD